MLAKIIASGLLVLLACSTDGIASTWDYRVEGRFLVEEVAQNVLGSFLISDEFIAGPASHRFDVVSFSLVVNNDFETYIFSGDEGILGYFHEITIPDTGEISFETQWGISNYFGDSWFNPFGGSIVFFTQQMIEYSPLSKEHFGVLAPIISLERPTFASHYQPPDAPSFHEGGALLLTRTSAVPTPEPSTIILLAVGLLAPAIVRRRKTPAD